MNRTTLIFLPVALILLSIVGYQMQRTRLVKPGWTIQHWPPKGDRVLLLGDEAASSTFGGSRSNSSNRAVLFDKTTKKQALTTLTIEHLQKHLEEVKPDLVVLSGGIYDLASGVAWKSIWEHFESLGSEVRSRQIPLVFLGLIPPNMDNFSFGFRDASQNMGVFLVEHSLSGGDLSDSGEISPKLRSSSLRQKLDAILDHVYR